MEVPFKFNLENKGQRYKIERLDTDKGSNQLYIKTSTTKKIKADFTVGNACFVANISEGIAHSTGVFLG